MIVGKSTYSPLLVGTVKKYIVLITENSRATTAQILIIRMGRKEDLRVKVFPFTFMIKYLKLFDDVL